ncbi:MAG TPA: FAD-dependent oxidoreductase [Chitinophagaceae bacterium]|nr:FAD-dependent oxidoreductase [Chitinophagaceae bacterium]
MASIWEQETFYKPQDVLIIGSGFTGLWSALHLKKRNPRLKITLVDRGIIPTGASTRNAGFACFGSLTELMADEQKSGTDRMLELVTMRFKGLQQIRSFSGARQIDMDMPGGFELFGPQEQRLREDLEHQVQYLNRLLKEALGRKRVYRLCDNRDIRSFGFSQVEFLIRNHLEGYLHPGKLVRLLMQQLQQAGVQFLFNTEVRSFSASGSRIILESNLPVELSARQLLICTNGFARQLLPDLDVQPARGQVLVTSPIENLTWKGTFHYEEGFYYFRNLGHRVLLGGARNKALQEETTYSLETSASIQDELERFLREIILPGREFSITHRWSGTMGVGAEKMPVLKEVSPGVLCCVRMSGMGVALAPELGKENARRLLA